MSAIKVPKNSKLKNQIDGDLEDPNEKNLIKVEFLELKERDDENDLNSEGSINSTQIKKLSKRPILLDFPLPRPNVANLNKHSSNFELKCNKNRIDNKYLSGEIDGILFQGKTKTSDFKPSQ